MSSDRVPPEPRRQDPEADASELYDFAEEPPPLPPTTALPAETEPDPEPAPDPLEGELDLDLEEKPRRRRKKKRRRDEAEFEPVPEPAPEPGDRILQREELPPPREWWVVPAVVGGIGFALCLVPIGVLAAREGLAMGIGLVVLAVFAVVLQVAAVTGFLTVVGSFFGIDYGPAVEAVGKLAAVVLIVDGVTGVSVLWNPCALVLGVLVGAAVFQYLFRLSVFEMLLSVAGMVGASWVLNAAILAILVSKR